MKRLLWLYPRSWRRRYRREMEALLEKTPTTPRALLDLLSSPCDAWLHPQPMPSAATFGRRASRRCRALTAAPVLCLALLVAWWLLGGRHGPWGGPLPWGSLALGAGAAGLVVGLLAALLRRRRGSRRWPRNEDPGEGAPVPARPHPDAPPALTAAGRASRGSGRRSDLD
ncbi:MAG: hypothetical protein M3075_11845 [Candidatus Dormibacteraeota bacterium]|nr:hypothetical protein [Candidatus Dormibacteraeota bacterium]